MKEREILIKDDEQVKLILTKNIDDNEIYLQFDNYYTGAGNLHMHLFTAYHQYHKNIHSEESILSYIESLSNNFSLKFSINDFFKNTIEFDNFRIISEKEHNSNIKNDDYYLIDQNHKKLIINIDEGYEPLHLSMIKFFEVVLKFIRNKPSKGE